MHWGAAMGIAAALGLMTAVEVNAQTATTTGFVMPPNAEAIIEAHRAGQAAFQELLPPGVGAAGPSSSPCSPSAEAFNWRDYGKVTPAKDQRDCAACWAFAANAAIETSYMVFNNNMTLMPNLSEQQVLDCAWKKATTVTSDVAYNCKSGWFEGAFNLAKTDGVVASTLYPAPPRHGFQRKKEECTPVTSAPERIVIGDFYQLPSVRPGHWIANDQDIKDAICKYGGVVAALSTNGMPNRDIPFTGILNGPASGSQAAKPTSTTDVDHAIQIVGWDNKLGVWIIKNSWGENWGDLGFARVLYNTRNIGFMATGVKADRELVIKQLQASAPGLVTNILNAQATINAALPDLVAKKATLSVIGKQIMVMPKQ